MKSEDWSKGMENEAASVEDGEWARETRWAARQRSLWGDVLLASLGALSLAGIYWWLWLGLVRCRFGLMQADSYGCWVNAHSPVLGWLVPLAILTLMGVSLGMNRVRLSVATAIFLLSPLFIMVVAVALQLITPPSDITYGQGEHLNLTHYTPRGWQNILSQSFGGAAVILLGTWLGGRFRHSYRQN